MGKFDHIFLFKKVGGEWDSNLGILCTEEGGGVQVALALVAAEAVLVEEAMLGRNLLGLEDSAFAANPGKKVKFD